MSEQSKIDEIKKSLSTVTSGKWNVEGVEIWRRGEDYNHEENPHLYIGEILRTENAEFIASASVNIKWLIEQLEQAQEEVNRLKEGAVLSHELSIYTESMKFEMVCIQLEQAQQENERLKEITAKDTDVIISYALDNQKLIEALETVKNAVIESKGQIWTGVSICNIVDQALQEVQHGTSKET